MSNKKPLPLQQKMRSEKFYTAKVLGISVTVFLLALPYVFLFFNIAFNFIFNNIVYKNKQVFLKRILLIVRGNNTFSSEKKVILNIPHEIVF